MSSKTVSWTHFIAAGALFFTGALATPSLTMAEDGHAGEMYGPPAPTGDFEAAKRAALEEFYANANESINSDEKPTFDEAAVASRPKVAIYTARGERDLAWDVGIEVSVNKRCRLYYQHGSMGRQPRNDPGNARIPNINVFNDIGAKCEVISIYTPAGRIGVWALAGITNSDSGKHGVPNYPGYVSPVDRNWKPHWGWTGQHVGGEIDLNVTNNVAIFARTVFYRYHQIDGNSTFGLYTATSGGIKLQW